MFHSRFDRPMIFRTQESMIVDTEYIEKQIVGGDGSLV